VEWAFTAQRVNLGAQTGRVRGAVTPFQFQPGGLAPQLVGPAYLAWLGNRMKKADEGGQEKAPPGETALMQSSVDSVQKRQPFDIAPNALRERLKRIDSQGQPEGPPKQALVTRLVLKPPEVKFERDDKEEKWRLDKNPDVEYFSLPEHLGRLKTL